ncbi:MAG TPA: LuxR C-terminal-related transcriptional regulator [Acidimicrobiales bacterium]|nr:LuxR C-terminal-related transcriptional regulator [Acidimicrobiales bacterium]
MRDEWALAGRDEELAVLRAAHDSGHRGVVIAGEPGVGKTRLASRFADDIGRADDCTVRWISGTLSLNPIALGPFAALLPYGGEPPSAGFHSLRWALKALADVAEPNGLVLGVDDAQWLDETSAALVQQVAAAGSAFVVMTCRTGVAIPEAVQSIWRNGHAERIELQPLSEPDVAALLVGALGGPIDAASGHRLWRVTGGNPLYLRELVRHDIGSGALYERGGVWMWSGGIAGNARLTELVTSHLDEGGAPVREALELLAVGEPLTETALGAVASWGAIEEAERLGLIEFRPSQSASERSARLAHPLYAEAIRASLGVAGLRRVSRTLADRLGPSESDVLRLAKWRLDSGAPADPSEMRAAARRAIVVSDHRLAERLARAALSGGGGGRAMNDLAEALYWQGRYAECEVLANDALAEAVDPSERADLAILRSSAQFFGLGQPAEAVQGLRAVEDSLGDEPHRSEVAMHRASIQMLSGHPRTAGREAQEVLTANRSTEAGRLRACGVAMTAWALTGEADRALELSGEALGLALQLAETVPAAAGGVTVGNSLALWLSGRPREAEEFTELLYRASVEREADDFRGVWAFLRGRAALEAGRVRAAASFLQEAVAALSELDPGRLLSWALACQAHALALLGDSLTAAGVLAEAEEARFPGMRIYETDVALATTWVRVSSGALTDARAQSRVAAELAQELEQPAARAIAIHDMARLGDAEGSAVALADLVGSSEGRLVPRFLAHAAALADDDADALATAAREFENAGSLLLAAEAFAEAAAAFSRAGKQASSLEARSESDRLAPACGHPRTPSLVSQRAGPDLAWLTAREREVAELAARGETRQAIADRLFLSERTVGNHLTHIYSKLGLETREDLARLFSLT